MSTLYVIGSGSSISMCEGNIIVVSHDERKEEIPKETVDSILIYGRSQLSSHVAQFCLERGIRVSFFSENGKYYGQLLPETSVDVSRLRKQMVMTSSGELCIEFAKRIVSAKINNQIVLLRRHFRDSGIDVSCYAKQLKSAKEKVRLCNDIPSIMGYEGIASKDYFSAFEMLLPEEFGFKGRNRRPSKDPVNALLNLGYSMLYHELVGIIDGKGLCSYAGFMHQDRIGHASLASDLMEEWRPIIVDSTVLNIVRGKGILYDHFESREDECRVTKEGIKIFVTKLEQKMHTESKYIDRIEKQMDFRRALNHQVQDVVRMIEYGDIKHYNPVQIR